MRGLHAYYNYAVCVLRNVEFIRDEMHSSNPRKSWPNPNEKKYRKCYKVLPDSMIYQKCYQTWNFFRKSVFIWKCWSLTKTNCLLITITMGTLPRIMDTEFCLRLHLMVQPTTIQSREKTIIHSKIQIMILAEVIWRLRYSIKSVIFRICWKVHCETKSRILW